MELREQLELIEVEYSDDKKKATLTFLDEDKGEILEVSFNKQNYNPDTKKFEDDKEKSQKVEEWCEQYFETTFDKLSDCVGVKKDIYHYDTFNSLWESEYAQKFNDEQVGEIINATITNVTDNGNMIQIFYTDNETETLYKSNMSYSKYLEVRKEWMVDPIKRDKVHATFKDKFGATVENAEEIIGKEIMIEVKKAFGKFTYGDIKKPKWSK